MPWLRDWQGIEDLGEDSQKCGNKKTCFSNSHIQQLCVFSPIQNIKTQIKILENKLNLLNKGEEADFDNENEKFLSSIGLLSMKPKIIVCNVDEESLSKGNEYTNQIKEKLRRHT